MPEPFSTLPTSVGLEVGTALALVALLTVYELRRQMGRSGKGVGPLLFRLFTLQVGLLVLFFLVRRLFIFAMT